MYWKIFVKWFEIWNTVLGLIMYYSIEKRCLNNREREQKYIEEFRKRVLTNVIKKRNNLRESNRINFFFHGRGGIVYPPFILTFFFCQAQRKRRTKKEQESRQWSISKKKRKRKRKKKNGAQPTRDYSFRFIASSSWPSIVAVAPRTSSPAYRTPLYPPVISRLPQNCYTLNLSLVLISGLIVKGWLCALRISFIFHIVSRARITRQDLVEACFEARKTRRRGGGGIPTISIVAAHISLFHANE